jgi:integrase
MARTVRDANLETRNVRLKLAARKKPYFRVIDSRAHLGYYKGSKGGSWQARYFLGAGKYAYQTLGTADDTQDADGVAVLSFGQAQEKAREWFAQMARQAAGMEAKPAGPYLVKDAVADYLAWYKVHRKAYGATKNTLDHHVLPELGNIEALKLFTKKIQDWHKAIAASPARLRSRKHGKANTRAIVGDNAQRQRKATANRVLTVLKAALNLAWHEGKVASDDAWRKVKPFKSVSAPVIRYLTQAECTRLVNACEARFRQMVRAALLTGCRYSELTRLTVTDVNPDSGTLLIRITKSGKVRHVTLTIEAQDFFASAIAGKPGDALIFARPDGMPWKHAQQRRPLLDACKNASIAPAVSFHILRHTHGSLLAMAGVPLNVIAAQLGHADTRMTERHYAHLAPSYVADTIRAHFPNLGITGKSNVQKLV